MIDQHGWRPEDWDNLSLEHKAIIIASLEYHNEQRQKEANRANKKGGSVIKKVV